MTPLPILSCDGCGLCCSTQGTPPFCWDDGDRPPPHLEWPRFEPVFAYRYDRGEPCLWYDVEAKRCRHYEHRPVVCREFELGGEDCLRIRGEGGS